MLFGPTNPDSDPDFCKWGVWSSWYWTRSSYGCFLRRPVFPHPMWDSVSSMLSHGKFFRFFSVLTAVTWEFSKPLESRTRRCLLLYYIHHPRHSTSPTFTTPDVHHPCRTDGVYEDWDDCWYWWQRQLTPFSMWKTWPASLGRLATWSSSLTSWSTPASSTRTTPREAMQ